MQTRFLLLGALSFWSATATAQTLAQDAAAFGARESATHLDLSPDGHQVVFMSPAARGASVASIADLRTGQSRPFIRSSGPPESLDWCRFVSNSRLICRYSGINDNQGQLIGYSRLIAVNADGSGLQKLGQQRSWYDERLRQVDGAIIDWLPGQGGAILMARDYVPEMDRTGTRMTRKQDGLGVDRVNTLTMQSVRVEPPRKDISDYMTDGRGNVRLILINNYDTDGRLTGRTRIDYRPLGSSDWRRLTDFGGEEIEPLAIDASINALYALKKLDGRSALYRIKLTDPPVHELVASHPRVDIDQVIRSANGQRVIGYGFAEEKREAVYFDPEFKALAASLRKALPGLPIIDFAGGNLDGTKTLVFAGSDSDAGRYYVFDRANKKLNEIILARPELEKRALAPVKPVSVRAPDGTLIPAYLTLPRNKPAKALPAVVLPHGGPSARDEWGFDWLAQFFAARGYAVIQPNFRGSAGFGDKWLLDNGFKSWRTSIGDITASIRWLVAEGIADPSKLAAVGWSYGGYAALQAAATEPGLFKAVAAIAPVTDLGLMKADAQNYTNSELVEEFVGTGPHVVEGSPLKRASSIKAPVVLVHGDLDSNVRVSHSVRMAAALQAAGTPVQFLRYPNLDHGLEDSAARSEMLSRIGSLLEQTIGR